MNLRLAKIFCDCVVATDADAFAAVIVHLFNNAGRTLPLIRTMIELEFQKASKDMQGAILRGNNIVNKIEGVYVREVGRDYLCKILQETVEEILNAPQISFEIDPT